MSNSKLIVADLKPFDEVTILQNATLNDAVELILEVSNHCANTQEVADVINLVGAEAETEVEFLESLANFVYRSAYFEPDPADHQKVRTVKRVLRDRKANCVDYVTFLSAVLQALKIPHSLRLVSMPGSDKFTHIYVVTESGFTLDLVPGQNQHGQEHLERLPGAKAPFDIEVEYGHKFDHQVL